MSPPPALPLDHHLIISNSSSKDHSSLLLGLALRSTSSLDDLSLSPTDILTTGPSLTLSLLFPATTQPNDHHDQSSSRDYNNNNDEISSFSNSTVCVKRPERDEERPDDDAAANNNNIINDEYEVFNNNIGLDGGSRKKLRLNKEQLALLEDSFKLHGTLNPKQKEALARQLNLRPRQVEVWFQNRRARNKLKQTEVDCEFLKKCCERLAKENHKLQKELLKLPFYLQLPSARLTMCPSCERLLPAKNNHANFLTSSKKCMIFSPFTKPSSAC